MPLSFPGLGRSKSNDKHDNPAYIPSSSNHVRRPSVQVQTQEAPTPPILQHHSSSTSSASESPSVPPPSNPASILRRGPHKQTSTGGESTTSSSSSSAFAKRFSGLNLSRKSSRTDQESLADSYNTDDGDPSGGSGSFSPSTPTGTTTPATSVSSLENNCPLPKSTQNAPFPFFSMTLSNTGTLSFIALPIRMRAIAQEAIAGAWRKGFAKAGEVDYLPEVLRRAREQGDTRCEGGVWEVTMKDTPWMPSSADKVASRRILLNLMTAFAKEGYSLASSYRTSAKDSSKDTLTFMRGDRDPDPVFMAIAFHSHDRIWIIDAEADIGEAVEEGIKQFWDKGIRDARVRERHCRELRLRGDPWTSHHANSLISSRIIHLVILKHITRSGHDYDFVGSVNMSDAEEGEMPVTFFRKQWCK